MHEDVYRLITWIVGVASPLVAGIIGWDKWVKSRVEIQRLKLIDIKSIKELMEITATMKRDVEELRHKDLQINKEIEKLDNDISQIRDWLMRFLDHRTEK